jgi:hypothetical protein
MGLRVDAPAPNKGLTRPAIGGSANCISGYGIWQLREENGEPVAGHPCYI